MAKINCTKTELERRIALCEVILEANFLHKKETEGIHGSSYNWATGYEQGSLSAHKYCLETFKEIIYGVTEPKQPLN